VRTYINEENKDDNYAFMSVILSVVLFSFWGLRKSKVKTESDLRGYFSKIQLQT